MKLSQIVSFGLFGLAVAGGPHVEKRAAADIIADLKTMTTDLTAFDNSIINFTGSLLQALGLVAAYLKLDSSINTCTTEVKSTGALSKSDSSTIVGLLQALVDLIVKTLQDVEDQNPIVELNGYTIQVCEALLTLHDDSDLLFMSMGDTIEFSSSDDVLSFQDTSTLSFQSALAIYDC